MKQIFKSLNTFANSFFKKLINLTQIDKKKKHSRSFALL